MFALADGWGPLLTASSTAGEEKDVSAYTKEALRNAMFFYGSLLHEG